MDPVINHQAEELADPNSLHVEHHKILHYLSNPWIIAVCMVIGLVLCFNIAMICYLQCSTGSGTGKPSFINFNKNNRKGYSNVAVDSEDLSNSEMEAINVE